MSSQHDEVGIFSIRNFLDNARRPPLLDAHRIRTNLGAERIDKRAKLGADVSRGLLRMLPNGVLINAGIAQLALCEHFESVDNNEVRI